MVVCVCRPTVENGGMLLQVYADEWLWLIEGVVISYVDGGVDKPLLKDLSWERGLENCFLLLS